MSELKIVSLRDYFAAKALHGLIASFEYSDDNTYLAKHAYQIADAMLAEREPYAIKEAMRWGINGNREHKE